MSSKPFHHGNLPAALIDAAIAEIEVAGFDRLSLRRVADRAGVSHAAPYRHFSSKGDLLRQVALTVQRELYDAYVRAGEKAKPRDRFTAACQAYLELAISRPHLLGTSFAARIVRHKKGGEWPDSVPSAYELFVSFVSDLLHADDRDLARAIALTCWAALQGFADLRRAGALSTAGDIETVKAQLLRVVSFIPSVRFDQDEG